MTPSPGSAAVKPARTGGIPLPGKVCLGIVALALLWAVAFPNSHTRRVLTEQCTSCFALRRTAERGLWIYERRVLGGATTVGEELGSALDLGPLLGGAHAHRWRFSGMGFSFLGLGNGVACGTPGFNPVALAMRNDPGERLRIEARVAAGEFRRDEVLAILELPPSPTERDSGDPSRLHLFRRGQDLLRSTGCEEAGQWPGAPGKGHPADCPCRK